MADADRVVQEVDGVLAGPPRTAYTASNSAIHNAEIARRQGFRGGVVGGSRHLNTFGPIMLELWGPSCFERGGVSMYFESTVVAGEQVRGLARRPAPGAAATEAWIERADAEEALVGRGTLTYGDHGGAALQKRNFRFSDPSGLRLLNRFQANQPMVSAVSRLTAESQAEQLRTGEVNEPLPMYVEASPWGGPIAAISRSFELCLRPTNKFLLENVTDTTPMGGAVEVLYREGPVFLDRDYRIESRCLGVGQSPKTEYIGIDYSVEEESGKVVATARQLYRFLKAGSPLYPELRTGA